MIRQFPGAAGKSSIFGKTVFLAWGEIFVLDPSLLMGGPAFDPASPIFFFMAVLFCSGCGDLGKTTLLCRKWPLHQRLCNLGKVCEN